MAEEAVALSGSRSSWWTSPAWCVLSFTALYGGDHRRARSAMLRAGGGPGPAGLQPTMRPLFLEALVCPAVAAGDLADAENWAERAAVDAEHLGLPTQRASALRSAGAVLAGRGEPGPAAERYARAAEAAAAAGATLWESQALLTGADLTGRAGDPEAATALWHRGRRLAEAGGSRLLTGLADLFPPPPPPPRAPGGASPLPHLTPRERQIAALVAEGLTTPAIAARLYLSPCTVDTHLSHIFRKAGVTTRSALAALTARDCRPAARLPRNGTRTCAHDRSADGAHAGPSALLVRAPHSDRLSQSEPLRRLRSYAGRPRKKLTSSLPASAPSEEFPPC